MSDEPPLHVILPILFCLGVLIIPDIASPAPSFSPDAQKIAFKASIPISFITEQQKDIMHCESRHDPTAQNPISTAYGVCQFLDSTWEYVEKKWGLELDREDYQDQIYACRRLLKEEGTEHWLASKYCWNK